VTDAIVDALLESLAGVELHAGEAFDLDTSMKVLESAAALLQTASAEERRRLIARADALAATTVAPEKKEFLENIRENLGIDS
jgi:hypothetical protein